MGREALRLFFKSLAGPTFGGRYERIRKRTKGRPNQDVYDFKVEVLGELEQLSEQEVLERLDMLSLSIHKPTFIVLDNASIHTAKIIKARIPVWQRRGLHLFYLPTYSPQLNIAETLWRHMKGGLAQTGGLPRR